MGLSAFEASGDTRPGGTALGAALRFAALLRQPAQPTEPTDTPLEPATGAPTPAEASPLEEPMAVLPPLADGGLPERRHPPRDLTRDLTRDLSRGASSRSSAAHAVQGCARDDPGPPWVEALIREVDAFANDPVAQASGPWDVQMPIHTEALREAWLQIQLSPGHLQLRLSSSDAASLDLMCEHRDALHSGLRAVWPAPNELLISIEPA